MMRYLATMEAMRAYPQKNVAYLSAEFPIGPQLNNLPNLGIQKEAEEALSNSASSLCNRSLRSRRSQVSATAALDWRPATWNPWPA